jgi:phenylalanyl-tRNA synthetase beta chain
LKISLNWLKEFVDFDKTPAEIAEILLFQGFETTVLSKSCDWTKVVTAKVLEVNKHPNADKLHVCSVNDGTNNYSIVCGAPNVAVGQTIALAQLGAELPGGFKIEPRKLRGVDSQGMICSEKELGLGDGASGIMVLDPQTEIGIPLEKALNRDNDIILEVETTTSRPDCLNHLGIARELAAYLKKKVKIPEPKTKIPNGPAKITITDKELCQRYIAYRIAGVKVGTSPDWIAKRLEKCGIRPINNIVDITNYVMLEIGHPLHAFDYNLLEGKEIVVRQASAGEKILALDGKEYTLDPEMLAICDTVKPQAIAGIMGGEHSGVRENTTEIILESAVFLATNIRRTSKKLALTSDSSYRFERGCSWEMAELAAKRAVELIEQISLGKSEGFHDLIAKPYEFSKVELRHERANKVLGTSISKEDMFEMLRNLNLSPAIKGDGIVTIVPSYRQDIKLEADLIEEVARMHGYGNIPSSIMPLKPDTNEGERNKDVESVLRNRFVTLGFCEVMNNTFTSKKQLNEFDMQSAEEVLKPLSEENESLRPNLLPGLLSDIKLNLSQGLKTVKLFETGNIFTTKGEKRILAAIACGDILPEWWKFEDNKINSPAIDVSYIIGIINSAFSGQNITLNNTETNKACLYFHPGKWAQIVVNGKVLGQLGVIHPKYTLELGKEAIYVEIDLGIVRWANSNTKYEHLKIFPQVKRDLSLVAGAEIPYKDIEKRILDIKKVSKEFNTIFEDVIMFSRYELKDNKISYSLHLKFQHPEHTLTENEINTAVNLILETLKTNLNISLRT